MVISCLDKHKYQGIAAQTGLEPTHLEWSGQRTGLDYKSLYANHANFMESGDITIFYTLAS